LSETQNKARGNLSFKRSAVMAEVQKSAFALSSATLMIGRAFIDDVFSLQPDKHSVGMVSEVNVSLDSSINSLLNGVAQAEVDAKRTGVSASITGNVFEMTAQNFMRSHAMSGSAVPVKRGRLTVAVASGATSLTIASDPIPGEATSAIAALGDIPAGSTILIQRGNGETDYVFPTVTSAAATGTGPYVLPLDAAHGVPADMTFPVGARVWVVQPIGVGDIDADDLFCAKIVGTLSNFDRPMVFVAPKIRMVKGFGLSFNETQYSSMAWEMKPLLLSRGELTGAPRLDEIGTRRPGRLYVGG
jgi:hypothetical protein